MISIRASGYHPDTKRNKYDVHPSPSRHNRMNGKKIHNSYGMFTSLLPELESLSIAFSGTCTGCCRFIQERDFHRGSGRLTRLTLAGDLNRISSAASISISSRKFNRQRSPKIEMKPLKTLIRDFVHCPSRFLWRRAISVKRGKSTSA